MDKKRPIATEGNQATSRRRTWEPMRVRYMGHVAEVLQGGGGKLSLAGSDPGDVRKPSGGGG